MNLGLEKSKYDLPCSRYLRISFRSVIAKLRGKDDVQSSVLQFRVGKAVNEAV